MSYKTAVLTVAILAFVTIETHPVVIKLLGTRFRTVARSFAFKQHQSANLRESAVANLQAAINA